MKIQEDKADGRRVPEIQDEILLAKIRTYIEANGFPPSRREVSDMRGHSSTGSGQDALQRLERAGHITLAPGISRGIRLANANARPEPM